MFDSLLQLLWKSLEETENCLKDPAASESTYEAELERLQGENWPDQVEQLGTWLVNAENANRKRNIPYENLGIEERKLSLNALNDRQNPLPRKLEEWLAILQTFNSKKNSIELMLQEKERMLDEALNMPLVEKQVEFKVSG